jgi:YHS domain-containing protein
MGSTKKIRILLLCFALGIVYVLIMSCNKQPQSAINMGPDGIAIKGYDTVAYFTMGKPVKGDEQYSHEWNGAKWLFSNRAHLNLFAVDPEKYAPQFGGY